MSEISGLRNITKTVLREIAKQANGLAVGLQNAAPPEEGGPGKSVVYLGETAAFLQQQIRLLEPPPEE